MFKIASKSFNQQRAVLKPLKNTCIFEEEEEGYDEDDANDVLDDASSSCYSLSAATHTSAAAAVTTHDSRNETMMLAQFFSTTGPEELSPRPSPQSKGDTKTQHQFKRASRLLSRLRKKPTLSAIHTTMAETISTPKRTHIPLPAYPEHEEPIETTPTTNTYDSYKKPTQHTNHLRDSGVYSETASERDSTCYHPLYVPPVPTPPPPSAAALTVPTAATTAFLTDLQQFPQPPFYKSSPRRPAPLPPAVASAAIASACSPTTTGETIRSVPEAALKRRSVRLRHVQVQTDVKEEELTDEIERRACPHCRQSIGKDHRMRRPSCPPALASTDSSIASSVSSNDEQLTDTKALMAMVVKLKSQLAEEKQCRIKLENQMSKRDELAKEKDKWAGACLWLNDRIALLPE